MAVINEAAKNICVQAFVWVEVFISLGFVFFLGLIIAPVIHLLTFHVLAMNSALILVTETLNRVVVAFIPLVAISSEALPLFAPSDVCLALLSHTCGITLAITLWGGG